MVAIHIVRPVAAAVIVVCAGRREIILFVLMLAALMLRTKNIGVPIDYGLRQRER